MAKILKWLLVLLGGLLSLLLAVMGIGWWRLNRSYTFPAAHLQIPTDAASIARGRHIVESVAACQGCHGERLQGRILINNPLFAILPAPNLTPAADVSQMSNEEWVLMFRHGIDEETHKSFLIMPASNFSKMSNRDLAAVIAYLKSLPPVENDLPEKEIGPVGYFLAGLGQLNNEIEAERIDHNQSPTAVPEDMTPEYGRYLATIANCAQCHGGSVAGNPGSGPGIPGAPNLSMAGPLRTWTEADFIKAIRTGERPDGSKMSDQMPWQIYGRMTDDELKAIWIYLRASMK